MTDRGERRFGRADAMAARPVRLPAARTEPRDGGGLYVTVCLERPRWQRWLGADETFERTFGLDALGRRVYEMCDGRRKVSHMARDLAEERKISRAEAEIAVTTFLKTLMSKGLVAAMVDRRNGSPRRQPRT
jgi:hypothetical protein